jgi:hypothetical protein
VHGTEHSVELTGLEQVRDDTPVPVRFTQFDSADDPERRELVAASLQAFQVSIQIQRRRNQRSVWCDERLEMLVIV